MPFDWLDKFQSESKKSDDYAEKTLAAYKLGMKAKGSIAGVRIVAPPDACDTCLETDTVYHPDDAPRLPHPDCTREGGCQCVYRPVMTYEIEEETTDNRP